MIEYPKLVKAKVGSHWYRGVLLGPKAQVNLNTLEGYKMFDQEQVEIVELTVVENDLPLAYRLDKDTLGLSSSSATYYTGDDATFYGINEDTLDQVISETLNDLRELIACKIFLEHEDDIVDEQRSAIEQIEKALDDDRKVSDENISTLLQAIKSGRFKVVEDV